MKKLIIASLFAFTMTSANAAMNSANSQGHGNSSQNVSSYIKSDAGKSTEQWSKDRIVTKENSVQCVSNSPMRTGGTRDCK